MSGPIGRTATWTSWSRCLPTTGLFGPARLRHDVESALDAITVDVVPAIDLKPEIRRRVEQEAIRL